MIDEQLMHISFHISFHDQSGDLIVRGLIAGGELHSHVGERNRAWLGRGLHGAATPRASADS